jgi:hypothetical protein
MIRKAVVFIFMILVIAILSNAGSSTASAKLDRVVYITLSKACGCMKDKCQLGDSVVDRVFVGARQGLLKRIDYSTDKAAAREYIGKYRLSVPPSLLFLDAQGNLIWRADGEVDYDVVLAKLKELGA